MENQLKAIAARIKELRLITEKTPERMAEITRMRVDDYLKAEEGEADLSFTFIHNCAREFGVDITELITGDNAKLSSYSIVRKGEGMPLERRRGFKYSHLASMFKGRLSEPFLVRAKYDADEQNQPIPLVSHIGEEFDYILSGALKININGKEETLYAGDAIYYDSSEPHGMIATGGEDCEFMAIVTDAHGRASSYDGETHKSAEKKLVKRDYWGVIEALEDTEGHLHEISFNNTDNFNFAFDIVDVLAKKTPSKLAMLHLDSEKFERRFTFGDMSRLSSQAANYFKKLGIKKGDRVMVILKRHYQFWIALLGLCKLGAVAVPSSNQLMKKDFVYRFNSAGINGIICTADGDVANQADLAMPECPTVRTKIIVNGDKDGWHNFNEEFATFSDIYPRTADCAAGNDNMLMFFSSGTTGYPKAVMHNYLYPLGHFVTAKYWHNVDPDGLHFTISDTGWGKALWGKLYGQWLCEAAVLTYDFERFDANDLLPLFKKLGITTFCAPPTMFRYFIKEDLSKFDMSSLKHATIAGEALNPEVFQQFYAATGLKLMEGFGQTETTLAIGNLRGMEPKPGSMGKPNPMYDIDIVDSDGKSVNVGETGEIIIRTDKSKPAGLFLGYYSYSSENDSDNINAEQTGAAWYNDMYHTGDMAWRDEDGYFWYVGRTDDLIKSSGYRIGPFEIESVIMELPYVLECAVTGAPDEIRGQVVKATIVLTKGTEPSDKLADEVKNYVKTHTAPYKYPRIVEFVTELPKTISGKIRRVEIRKSGK